MYLLRSDGPRLYTLGHPVLAVHSARAVLSLHSCDSFPLGCAVLGCHVMALLSCPLSLVTPFPHGCLSHLSRSGCSATAALFWPSSDCCPVGLFCYREKIR